MEKYITWGELSKEQLKAIDWFTKNPPKYYKWFYKFYKKFLGPVIFLLLVLAIILGIIHSAFGPGVDLFDSIKYIFFVACGMGAWSLSAFLYKHFYTKKYAKKIGLSIKNWNYLARDITWDI